MAENCTHDCSSCGESCGERTEPQSFLAELNPLSRVGKVFGVVSGKGGVGKSLTTGLLAAAVQKQGFKTAVLDADITGPSIPKLFGLSEKAYATEDGIIPETSASGIQIMSINLILENESEPVIWRGPIIGDMVKQFWTDVVWRDVDYMFVDMPPGTGDVPLTVFQSVPLDGIIVVTTPQSLVDMVVGKAVRMAEMMDIPLIGLVENMSYYECPDCGGRHEIFGRSHAEESAAKYGISSFARLPIKPEITQLCDSGKIELAELPELDPLLEAVLKAGKA